MSVKRSGWVATAGAALAGGTLWVAHAAGTFGNDVVRDARPGLVGALHESDEIPAIRQGISTFTQLRNGTDEEKVVASAACAAMNAYGPDSPSVEAIKADVARQLPVGFVVDLVVDRYLSRVANALYYAEINGGYARWYVQYCVFKK